MNDFAVRLLTAIVLIVIVLLAAVAGGYPFAILVAAIATATYYEWMRMVRGWGFGWKVAGFVYALLPALALLWIRERDADGLSLLFWIFIVTWTVDTGAYFAGRTFGKRKLAPTISPNKTWAGLYGGVASATLAAGAWALATGLSAWLLLLAPFFAVAAQAGDLFESWMKRRSGVKDSGHWLPGHGGLFDRIDGLIPVAILTLVAQQAGLT